MLIEIYVFLHLDLLTVFFETEYFTETMTTLHDYIPL